jgi:hypothetical protein
LNDPEFSLLLTCFPRSIVSRSLFGHPFHQEAVRNHFRPYEFCLGSGFRGFWIPGGFVTFIRISRCPYPERVLSPSHAIQGMQEILPETGTIPSPAGPGMRKKP